MHFWRAWGKPCDSLRNIKSWECGRTRVFELNQRSIASPLYTSFNDVTRDFGRAMKELTNIRIIVNLELSVEKLVELFS